MHDKIPSIEFTKEVIPQVQVLKISELKQKLQGAIDHNSFQAHKIEFHFILILTKGSYTHFIDFHSYDIKKGGAIFVAKNQVHHFTKKILNVDGFAIVIKSELMERYHFLSDNIQLNRLFNYHLDTPIISQSDLGEDSFLDIAALMHKEYVTDKTNIQDEMMRTLLHILLLRAERAKEANSYIKVKSNRLELFILFKNSLEKEYVNTRSSSYYAKKLHVSYKYLNDIVKELTAQTAKSFIDQFVTIEIKRYLVSTSLSIKEIAFATGFDEPNNMVKFFKRNTQITPLSFRKAL